MMMRVIALCVIIDRVVPVIPAQAGIHVNGKINRVDSHVRGNDGQTMHKSL